MICGVCFMKKMIYVFLCLSALSSCSCKDAKVEESHLRIDAVVTHKQEKKALMFADALTNGGKKRASVYIYRRLTMPSYSDAGGAKRLAARIVLMGFTDVLLSVHPVGRETFALLMDEEWIRIFNAYLNKHNVKVHALMFSEPVHFNEKNNRLIWNQASVIQGYNCRVSRPERFAGASADWEPHMLHLNSKFADEAHILPDDRWGNDRYGKDGANDRLLKRTLEMLAYAKSSMDEIGSTCSLPHIPLNQAVNYHMQEQYDAGMLRYGNINSFLESGRCEDVNVMAYNENKKEIWRRASSNLADAESHGKENCIYICIKTRLGDDEGAVTSLKPKGWNHLIETLKYLHMNADPYSSMKGISIYDYSDTEDMWLNGKN